MGSRSITDADRDRDRKLARLRRRFLAGAYIWADRFDGLLDGVFELQDQVASSVAGAIEPTLRKAQIERARRKPTESSTLTICTFKRSRK